MVSRAVYNYERAKDVEERFERGREIKRLRLRRGMGQRDLGLLVGMSSSAISMLESGKKPISNARLDVLEDALGIRRKS